MRRFALALSLTMALAATWAFVPVPSALAATPVSVTLSAAGDCTLGIDSHFNQSTGLPAMYSSKGAKYFLKQVKGVFEKDDVTIVNLEGTLTTRGQRADKTFAFRGNPRLAKILTAGDVEIVSFANNHAFDYGSVSHTDTIKAARKAGLKVSSYARVCRYKAKGKIIGFVAVNDIGGPGDCRTLISKGIAKLRQRGVDAIVVSIHWGIEKKNYANGQQRSLAHYAVNKGADLVLGTHPHVIQGIERYKGVNIVYSLGNFCFGGNSNPADKDTIIFQQTFTWNSKGKLSKTASKARIIPCSVSGHSYYNDYQPRVLKGSAKARVIKRMKTYSASYGITFTSKGWLKKRG